MLPICVWGTSYNYEPWFLLKLTFGVEFKGVQSINLMGYPHAH
jgi:hypothetical protein